MFVLLFNVVSAAAVCEVLSAIVSAERLCVHIFINAYLLMALAPALELLLSLAANKSIRWRVHQVSSTDRSSNDLMIS